MPSISACLYSHRVCLLVLLVLHLVLLVHSIHCNSVTIDELAHIPAGLGYWRHGSFFSYHHNPPLVKLLEACPVTFSLDINMEVIPAEPKAEGGQHWRVGRQFMRDNAEHYVAAMRLARYPVVSLSIVAGWFLFRWGRKLWGESGGLIAVAIWVVHPEVLAHAGLATVDLGATAFGLIASYSFWKWLNRPSWWRVLVAAVMLGAALLSKFTLLLLGPIWFVVWVLVRTVGACKRRMRVTLKPCPEPLTPNPSPQVRGEGSEFAARPACELTQAVVGMFMAIFVVNGGYCFQGSGQKLGSFSFLSSTLGGPLKRDASRADDSPQNAVPESRHGRNRFADSWLASVPVPLPREFVLGFDEQLQHAEVREGDMPARFTFYLNGERRREGWWYYYFYGMLLKTPIGILALVLTAAAVLIIATEYRGRFADEVVLWLTPLAIIAAMSLGTEINIGVRYVLPAWPYLILAAARLGRAWTLRDWPMRLLVVFWSTWAAASTLLIHPHYLSYFNAIAGGPDNGWRYLADSNIDWGQDLLELKRWVDRHPEARPLHLAYAGTVDPHIAGLEYELPPSGFVKSGEWDRYGPSPGWFAVSVNLVVGLPFWTTDANGESRPTQEDEFGYFRMFEPVAKAGYSIFIYHIELDQANEARKKLGLPELAQ